jgi:acetylornithine deacetylase/succinyl-diaminopimelate desuccinylase-like protein
MLQLAGRATLKGKLIFAATADEEAGGRFGVKYLLEKYPEILKTDFAVNEGAEDPQNIGGKTVNFIQVGEKGTAWTKIVARGVSCHGSVPALGDNAILKMSGALEKLSNCKPPVTLLPEVREMLQELVRLKGVEMKIGEDNVDEAADLFEDRSFSAYLKAITRMTISPNMIRGGLKTNIIPDYCEAELDIRVLPGQDKAFVLRELRHLIGDELEMNIANYYPPSFSPTSSPFFELIAETLRDTCGEVKCLPCLSAGATDSRFLRQLGIPAYGVAIMAPGYDEKIKKTIHGKNERIDIASLHLKAEFLIRLAEKYLAS